MQRSEPDDGVTLAELLATFSLATDLGMGQPMEHVLRAWRIAARLADQVGLDVDERASLYFIAVLAWVGCVADTPEVARWFGDDIAFRGDSYQTELAGLPGSRSCSGMPVPEASGCIGCGWRRPSWPPAAKGLSAASCRTV